MKIVHICLAAPYVDGFGYQENILSQLHAEMGNQVTVLTSEHNVKSNYEMNMKNNNDYVNDYGIHIKVLQKSGRYGWYSRFKDFDGLYEILRQKEPDIIFVHGGQFVALRDVIEYCRNHRNIKLFIDQHGDYYNMHVNTWKEKLVHHWVYGHWIRKAAPLTQKFWGVTPWRCQYLHEVYRIPEDKIGLLVMGGDDRYIRFEKMPHLRNDIRRQLNLEEEDFVVITGGKIDSTKNIHLLMQAIIDSNLEGLKLIVFGKPDDKMELLIKKYSEDGHIRNIGWLNSTKVYDYFLASDLVVFPGTHSVLWEQACACGIPGLFKDWEGMHHVDVGGNCHFLTEDSIDEIKNQINNLYFDRKSYYEMKNIAQTKAIKKFSYRRIAKKSIGQ